MNLIKNIILVIIGFSSGTVVAGAIFAFIAIIGIVPRLSQKTNTQKYIPLYEDAITLGGIFGALDLLINWYIPLGNIGAAIWGFAVGIFIGCLAVSLAEVINVVPIFARRARILKGISAFICALALGKAAGSFIYFYFKGFYI